MQLLDKKYLERWANAYSLMRTVPNDDRFDICYYGAPGDTPCGTTACIAGHAALHPWFRRRGLMPIFNCGFAEEMAVDTDEDVFGLIGGSWYDSPFRPGGAQELLGGRYCHTPKQAARAIKIWMETHWSKAEVKEAIADAVVEYDPEHVHKNVPWGCPA